MLLEQGTWKHYHKKLKLHPVCVNCKNTTQKQIVHSSPTTSPWQHSWMRCGQDELIWNLPISQMCLQCKPSAPMLCSSFAKSGLSEGDCFTASWSHTTEWISYSWMCPFVKLIHVNVSIVVGSACFCEVNFRTMWFSFGPTFFRNVQSYYCEFLLGSSWKLSTILIAASLNLP